MNLFSRAESNSLGPAMGRPASLHAMLEAAGKQAEFLNWTSCTWFKDARKVEDQLDGGDSTALSSRYHPDLPGLKESQQELVRRARKHVNLAEAARDRLVNSIHAGLIIRRARKDADLQRALESDAHASAMTKLCENAFSYGNGYLVPIATKTNRLRYWHPAPRWTVPVVDPMDITRLLGIVEYIPTISGGGSSGYRFVTDQVEGSWTKRTGYRFTEHKLGIPPVVRAYGRDRTHEGKLLGKSLILSAADASIDVTNNELNLKILRDRFTQALLLIFGEPMNSASETKESLSKFLMFMDKTKGDAKYITPDSRIADLIELTKRFCTDTSVSTGLPLDTFLPETVTGGDASATAARNRAFPLQQRMVRLSRDWRDVERRTGAISGALMRGGSYAGLEIDDLVELFGIEVSICVSMPEAEAETLSNWQQKTEKFYAPIEDAIDYYSPHLPEDRKAELAKLWRMVHEPLEGKTEEELLKWKREVVKALFQDATTGDVMANLTKLGDLLEETGLPRFKEYEEPFLPVVAASGPLVSGETITDDAGDVVGGSVVGEEKADPPSPEATAGRPGDDDSVPTDEGAKGAPGDVPPAFQGNGTNGGDAPAEDDSVQKGG